MGDIEPNFNSDDYYEILGCTRDVSADDLKKKYRKLARKYHPDKDPDNGQANANFQKINEAYSVLKDNEKRQVYDEEGREGVEEHEEQEYENQRDDDSPPGSVQFDAENVYNQEFETDGYKEYYNDGSPIGVQYAEDFGEFDELLERFTYTFNFGCGKPVTLSFFRTFLIKRELNYVYATTELVTNWVIILAFFGSLADPSNVAFDWIGGIAILTNAYVLHFFYGFFRYPSCSRRCALDKLERLDMDYEWSLIRDECSFLLYGNYDERKQTVATVVTILFTAINHFASICASYVCCLVMCMTNEERREERKGNTIYTYSRQRMTQEEMIEASGNWGIIGAIIFYPILRIFGDTGAVIFSTLGMLFQQHYYDALLFRKTTRDFLVGMFVGVLFVVVDGVVPVDVEIPDVEADQKDEKLPKEEDQKCEQDE